MQVISLDGIWEFSFYPQKFYEDVWNTDFSAADIMCVPGAFDMLPDYYCQRGTGLYRRTFELAEDVKNAFIRVHGMVEFLIDNIACVPPMTSTDLGYFGEK